MRRGRRVVKPLCRTCSYCGANWATWQMLGRPTAAESEMQWFACGRSYDTAALCVVRWVF